MSQLREYRQKRALLEQLQKEVESFEQDPKFKSDFQFLERLNQLKEEFGKSDRDVMDIINPPAIGQASTKGLGRGKGRRHVTLKLWRNPHTGEEVESKNLLNKRLQEWAEEYGRDEVKRWVVETRDAG